MKPLDVDRIAALISEFCGFMRAGDVFAAGMSLGSALARLNMAPACREQSRGWLLIEAAQDAEEILRPQDLRWTNEPPTVPGWYWAMMPWVGSPRDDIEFELPAIVEVSRDRDRLVAQLYAGDGEDHDVLDRKGCLWAGPIPEPQTKKPPHSLSAGEGDR